MKLQTFSRYTVPLGATSIALAATTLLGQVFQAAPFVAFHLAVIVSAWFGGLLGGLFSAAVAVVAVDIIFFKPVFSLAVARATEGAMLGIFTLSASLISYLVARRKGAEEQLRYALEALTASEARFRVMAEAAPVMIWLATSGQGRTFFNARWLAFTGQSIEHESGDGWLVDVHPDDRAEVARGFRTDTTYRREYRLRAADGSYRWVLDSAVPLEMINGTRGSIGSCFDITDLKEAEAQRMALAREQAVSRAKDELLAQVSHDLRSPLTATMLWVDRLRSAGSGDAWMQRGLNAIARSTRSQLMLVNDLLDRSRLLFGKLSLNMRDVDLPALVSSMSELVRSMAELKSVVLQVAIDQDAGLVRGDPERLQQVLWNLLSNAVKFTPAGGTVTIRVSRGDGCARIEVADTGRGIRPDFLPHVFDRFRQQDAAEDGLGLGLGLVRHLVELHCGTVWAESAGEGRGARFTVDLPLLPVRF